MALIRSRDNPRNNRLSEPQGVWVVLWKPRSSAAGCYRCFWMVDQPETKFNTSQKLYPIGSMVLLYMVLHGSHQYTPFMLAYIPAPWILWVLRCSQGRVPRPVAHSPAMNWAGKWCRSNTKPKKRWTVTGQGPLAVTCCNPNGSDRLLRIGESSNIHPTVHPIFSASVGWSQGILFRVRPATGI